MVLSELLQLHPRRFERGSHKITQKASSSTMGSAHHAQSSLLDPFHSAHSSQELPWLATATAMNRKELFEELDSLQDRFKLQQKSHTCNLAV